MAGNSRIWRAAIGQLLKTGLQLVSRSFWRIQIARRDSTQHNFSEHVQKPATGYDWTKTRRN